MGWNSRFGKVADATVTAVTMTYTTNAQTTISGTPTIADGSFVSTTEAAAIVFALSTQVTALVADVLAIRTQLNLNE